MASTLLAGDRRFSSRRSDSPGIERLGGGREQFAHSVTEESAKHGVVEKPYHCAGR